MRASEPGLLPLCSLLTVNLNIDRRMHKLAAGLNEEVPTRRCHHQSQGFQWYAASGHSCGLRKLLPNGLLYLGRSLSVRTRYSAWIIEAEVPGCIWSWRGEYAQLSKITEFGNVACELATLGSQAVVIIACTNRAIDSTPLDCKRSQAGATGMQFRDPCQRQVVLVTPIIEQLEYIVHSKETF